MSLPLSSTFILLRCGERTCSFALVFEFLGLPCLTTFREENESYGCRFHSEVPEAAHSLTPTASAPALHASQEARPSTASRGLLLVPGKRREPSHLALSLLLPFSGAFSPPVPGCLPCSLQVSAQMPPYQSSFLPTKPRAGDSRSLLSFSPSFPTTCVLCLHPGGERHGFQNLTAWVQSHVLFAGP